MKLYKSTASGLFHATQEAARKNGGPFSAVEVPSVGRDALAAFLNSLTASGLKAPPPDEIAAAPVAPQPTFNAGRPAPGRDGGPRLFSAGADNDAICEAIEEAEGNPLARIAEAVAFRFHHLAKECRDANRG